MHQDLAAHYQMFSDNPTAALSLVTPELTRLLTDSQHMFAISGEGNLFGLSVRHREFNPNRRRQPSEMEYYQILADESQRVVEQLTLSQRQAARAF